MHEYLFDLKLLASVRIRAETPEAAAAWLRENECADVIWGDGVTGEASMDGDADLIEVDGEAV